MNTVNTDDFLSWAASVDIGIDPRYPESGCLSLLPPRHHSRFWVVPPVPATWPYFTAFIVGDIDPWSEIYLWPRSGTWPAAGEDAPLTCRVRDVMLRGAGVPAGWAGALRIRFDELDAVLGTVFAYLAFGWCTDDDLFLIPDHGRQIVQTDHHDVVHVEFGSEQRTLEFVAHMAAAGYKLPTELPDETFKRPAWMKPAGTEPPT